MCQVENGNSIITPTESSESDRTWAIAPIRYENAQVRFLVRSRITPVTANPQNGVWVNPAPGQPRWNCTGSDRIASWWENPKPYTAHLVSTSGE